MRKDYTDYVFNFYVDNSKDIQLKTQNLIRKMMDLVVESDFDEISKLLRDSRIMRYSIQGYLENLKIDNVEKEMLVNAGYTSALIDAMQLYTEKLHIQYEIQKINTKYRDSLLRVLAKRGTLLHRDLAATLGLSASGLSAVIKQLNSTSVKMINVDIISKYKLYSLTPVALKYISRYMPPTTQQENFPVSQNMIIIYENDNSGFIEERVKIESEKEYSNWEKKQIILEKKTKKYAGTNITDFFEFKSKMA